MWQHISLANSNDEKVSNHKAGKAVGMKVKSKTSGRAHHKK